MAASQRLMSGQVLACILLMVVLVLPGHNGGGGVASSGVSQQQQQKCPEGTQTVREHCLCLRKMVCKGSKCVTGVSIQTKEVVHGYRPGCPDCECIPEEAVMDIQWRDKSPSVKKHGYIAKSGERVLVMTVATHREPFIDLVEQSVREAGLKLEVVGLGDFFYGYGWKLKQVLKTIQEKQADYDLVLFMDSFDTYLFTDVDELVKKFRTFEHPMVVSAEVNCWPNPQLAKEMPASSKSGYYPYPNSGTYMAEIPYLIKFYSEVISIQHKSDCCDDQGELIKAIALDHNAFKIDHNAVLFQTLFGRAKSDVDVDGSRVVNIATQTKPCVIHANGWDKEPLLNLLLRTGKLSSADKAAMEEQKATLEKTKVLQSRESDINDRCKNYDPNPSAEPTRNLIKEYGLLGQQTILKKQLEEASVPWNKIEQQIFEVQEYRTHCPTLPSRNVAVEGKLDKPCDKFLVYVYPTTKEEDKELSVVYRSLRQQIMEGPYYTPDPEKACVYVPKVDPMCWCEDCMFGAYANRVGEMHPKSKLTGDLLSKEKYWNQGRNHILFEFSDAACFSVQAEYAIIAKAGLSEFHYRKDHDISMPLFGMVEFGADARRKRPAEREFLVSFRGTRSARSDAMRNHLPKLHNGKDVILVCACRWFGTDKGYDKYCEEHEKEFQKYTYTQLATNSKFSLIVEGFGYHSFRLTEIMSAGSIPVIIVDHYVLPYEDILDWSKFSIRIPESRFMELPDILRSISPEKLEEMQQEVSFVYESFFQSLSAQVHTALESVRINMFTAAEQRAEERRLLQERGFPTPLPDDHQQTPENVIEVSKWCNTPVHRRKQAKDNAVMRL